jgi:hypothetical protein
VAPGDMQPASGMALVTPDCREVYPLARCVCCMSWGCNRCAVMHKQGGQAVDSAGGVAAKVCILVWYRQALVQVQCFCSKPGRLQKPLVNMRRVDSAWPLICVKGELSSLM